MTIFNRLRKVPSWVWIFVGALALRFYGLSHGLPDGPHPDENMVVRRALRFGGGDFNPHFFYYPSFAMYLVFIMEGFLFVYGRLAGWFHSSAEFARSFVQDPTAVYTTARALIAVADSVSVILIAKLGEFFFSRRAALLAALYWALMPMAVQYAQIAKPDSLMLTLLLLSLWIIRTPSPQRAFYSGLILGLSVSTKYTAVLLGPALLYWMWTGMEPKNFWKAVGLMALGGALGFVIGTPYAVLDYKTFWHDFTAQSEVMKTGVTGAEGGARGWFYYPGLFIKPTGYLLVALLAIGGFAAGRSNQRPKIMMGIFLLTVYLMLGSRRIYSAHYLAIVFPFIFLLAGEGLHLLWKRFEGEKPPPLPALVGVLFVVSFFPSLKELAAHVRTIQIPDTRTQAREWIEANVPPGTKILRDASGPELKMAAAQLEDLYKRASAAGHVKADLFKLQWDAADGRGYFVYLTEQPVMVTPKDLVDYSRQVQDLIPINQPLSALRQKGIKYVVASEVELNILRIARNSELHPEHVRFYDDLAKEAVLEAHFPSLSNPGPGLWIYRL